MSNRSAVAKFITVLIALVLLLPCIASATVYTLGVGDVLHITVWGHNELTTTVEVRPDGMITFPLVGDQLAAGRTTQDLAGDIQQELRAYVIEPHVTVLVSQFRTVGVQVLGEVKSPGYYQVRLTSAHGRPRPGRGPNKGRRPLMY